ncbi:hypothetical protein PILCRDRAFT_811390 [Piloderma croceum F 1598]|uniref:Uncharacterized protein n=1 Tax=Piloderma croceum (strain F 1598) TaxID=765440 RepID=A0A0C3GGX0_PILCF|nr:hypothetical protein PILCRDRAFT_811390 [Piloderma croceum F 1598]
MFAAKRVLPPFYHRRSRLLLRTGHGPRKSLRTVFTSAVEPLAEGFLDLALTLPFPSSLPLYSTTIILFTVVSRLAFTVPISIWAQRRKCRVQEIVEPTLEAMEPKLREEILQNMQEDGTFNVSYEDYNNKKTRAALSLKYKGIWTKRIRKMLAVRRKQLLREHNCRPLGTYLLPIITQLPLFVGSTIVLGHLSQSPTPFDLESFLMLTSLSVADRTDMLPIILGCLTLANVESSNWFMTEADRRKKAMADARFEKAVRANEFRYEWSRLVKPALRFASVGRICIACLVPGSVVLYWVSSATFGLLQTFVFDYFSWRRQQQRPLAAPSSHPQSSRPSA